MKQSAGVVSLLLLLLPDPMPCPAQVAGVAGTELVVPAYSTAAGANGAAYGTVLEFDAEVPPPVELALRVHPRGAAPAEARVTASAIPFALALSSLPGLGGTSGWLSVAASRPVRVVARTAGASFHAIPLTVAIAEGETSRLGGALAAFDPSAGARFNFGLAEVGGAPATVRACLAGTWAASSGGAAAGGPFESCRLLWIPAHGSTQVDALAGYSPLPESRFVRTAEVRLEVTHGPGRVVAWAASIDAANAATAWEMAPPAGLDPALGAGAGSVLLTKTGSGSGAIRLGGGEVPCDAPCAATVLRAPGDLATTLLAEPSPGSLFDGWSGCDDAAGPACTLLVPAARRVTAAFPLSRLTVDVFGFLDATVTAGQGSATCAGPVRRCEIDVAPGAAISVSAVAWPGGAATDRVDFSGPGCGAPGCALSRAPDPTIVAVEAHRTPAGARILYFGAWPLRVAPGGKATLLARTTGCNLSGELAPETGTRPLGGGAWEAVPAQTTTYTYACWFSLPGSSIREVERANVTVEVAAP